MKKNETKQGNDELNDEDDLIFGYIKKNETEKKIGIGCPNNW